MQNWPVKDLDPGRGWIHCVYGSDHPLKLCPDSRHLMSNTYLEVTFSGETPAKAPLNSSQAWLQSTAGLFSLITRDSQLPRKSSCKVLGVMPHVSCAATMCKMATLTSSTATASLTAILPCTRPQWLEWRSIEPAYLTHPYRGGSHCHTPVGAFPGMCTFTRNILRPVSPPIFLWICW